MSGKKKYIVYISYVLGAALFFLYIRFPTDTIADYISASVSERNPEMRVDIGKASPSLPMAVTLQSIALHFQEQPVFDAESARIAPAIWSLIGNKKRLKYQIKTGDGTITGQANLIIANNVQQITMSADIDNIQLNDLSAVKSYSQHNIWGILNGEVNITGMDANAKTDAKFGVNSFKIKLKNPLFNIDTFEFKTIDASITATPSRLQLKKCTFNGRDMDGEINGTISVRMPIENSILNFSGVIRPHPEFIARLSTTVPAGLLSPGGIGKNGISFRIRGTIGKPEPLPLLR